LDTDHPDPRPLKEGENFEDAMRILKEKCPVFLEKYPGKVFFLIEKFALARFH